VTVGVALGALLAVAVVGALVDGGWPLIAAVALAGALAVVISYKRAARRREAELAETRRDAERSARRTRDQLEAMLRGVADAVTAQAPDGRLLFANDAAVELLGFDSSEALLAASPADILSRFDIFDEAGRPYPAEELPGRRALQGEEGAEAIMRFQVRETGEERWSAVKATPVKNGAGVAMAINVIEDITAHKRSELAQRFLARSSTVLGGWHDLDELPTRVAGLAVPENSPRSSAAAIRPTRQPPAGLTR
jgi:PAS domain-containing protein